MKNQIFHTAITSALSFCMVALLAFTIDQARDARDAEAIAKSQELTLQTAVDESFARPMIKVEKCISSPDTPSCEQMPEAHLSVSSLAICKKPKCAASDNDLSVNPRLSNASLNLVLENYTIQKLVGADSIGTTYAFTIETFGLEVERKAKPLHESDETAGIAPINADGVANKRTFWERIFQKDTPA